MKKVVAILMLLSLGLLFVASIGVVYSSSVDCGEGGCSDCALNCRGGPFCYDCCINSGCNPTPSRAICKGADCNPSG